MIFTASGFGQLRDDNDANCTYEGDNNVLLQQTSNWLIFVWENKRCNSNFPMNTISYFSSASTISEQKWTVSPLSSSCSDESRSKFIRFDF